MFSAMDEPGFPPIRFSVVMAAYNAAATIQASLDSCLKQTYPAFEIIVVDDGSTDDTNALLRKAAAAGTIQLITLSENQGPSFARNQGMNAASGDFIAFQDAEDYWHPEKLRIIGRMLQQHPGVQFLFHPFTLQPFPADLGQQQPEPSFFPWHKLLIRNYIGTPCAVLKQDKTLRFREDMRYMEDYELWLRAGSKYGIYRLDLPLTRLGRPVLSAGGLSSKQGHMRAGELKAYRQLTAIHPAYALLLPFLTCWSLLKHLTKMVKPR
jgi:glycosyltransferase involved in cell wall biosynthesis